MVINRSKEILAQLTDADIVNKAKEIQANEVFAYEQVLSNEALENSAEIDTLNKLKEEILNLNLNKITPIEAINTLFELQEKVGE